MCARPFKKACSCPGEFHCHGLVWEGENFQVTVKFVLYVFIEILASITPRSIWDLKSFYCVCHGVSSTSTVATRERGRYQEDKSLFRILSVVLETNHAEIGMDRIIWLDEPLARDALSILHHNFLDQFYGSQIYYSRKESRRVGPQIVVRQKVQSGPTCRPSSTQQMLRCGRTHVPPPKKDAHITRSETPTGVRKNPTLTREGEEGESAPRPR